MADLDAVLGDNRKALDDLIGAAEGSGSTWNTPRAPGKWSPSQVVEHVALVLEESGKIVAGTPSKLGGLPSFLRPVIRVLFFNSMVKKGKFSNSRTSKAFEPESGPASPADARGRLDGAFAKFDKACRARAAIDQSLMHPIFGTISVVDYGRFQALHTRHHCKQIPGASPTVS
ncbi:MAG: DUF1569 domain-containing protein [Gemmatimonadales bacterium]|nr:MAG: DUF1569 domain-containing protein [Gemmatimonadales bacterium]